MNAGNKRAVEGLRSVRCRILQEGATSFLFIYHCALHTCKVKFYALKVSGLFSSVSNLQLVQFIDMKTVHMESQFCKAKQIYMHDRKSSPVPTQFLERNA